jgi:thymidylate kinase
MSEKSGFVLTLEGLPGSGKTTISEALKAKGWEYFPEVATLAASHGIVVGPNANLFSEIYILDEEIRREERVKTLKKQGEKIVLDNFHSLNLAYAKARNSRSRTFGYEIYLMHYQLAALTGKILKPDLYVYLKVSVDVSIKRQVERKMPEIASLDPEFLHLVERNLEDFHKLYEPDVPRVTFEATTDPLKLVTLIEKEVSKLEKRK